MGEVLTLSGAPVIDVAFDIEGASLPADHAWPLSLAIEARLPWLADEALCGIHPLRTAPTSYGIVLLARRTKLVLRVPQARLAESLQLEGATVDVDGSMLKVGAGSPRALRPSATLFALRVAAGSDDPTQFESTVAGWLRGLGIGCGIIAGCRRHSRTADHEIAGFGLALHGLAPVQSLRIQSEGLGGDRRIGWGVFVPAKAIAAADA
ncbi:MAG: type I-MYXAN CRISPR-associated protein Cas6/Cmx6 [Burkholderiales bacterium]|nr:type I-MYXAN CRISPR-associated protein Cas6/Cmx6 [Burkholderiales bacterium]